MARTKHRDDTSSEADRERQHELALHNVSQKWALYRLIAVGACILIGIGLTIPLALILVGTSTTVTVNIAFAFSFAVTLSVAVTGAGWWTAAKGKRAAEKDNRALRAKVRRLQSQQDHVETLGLTEAGIQ